MTKYLLWCACAISLIAPVVRAEHGDICDPIDDEYILQIIKEARNMQRESPLDLLGEKNEQEMLAELRDALDNIAGFINTPEAQKITQDIYSEMTVALEKIKQIQERTGVVTLDQALEKANSQKEMMQRARTEQSNQPSTAP